MFLLAKIFAELTIRLKCHLLLKLNHLPLILFLLAHEALLLLLQSLLHTLLVLHNPVKSVAWIRGLSLALLTRVEQSLHDEYFLEKCQA